MSEIQTGKPRYEQVESGIYRYTDKAGQVTYHERPSINGKRTYRSLGFNFTKQASLKNARVEYARRRTEISAGRNPYEENKPEPEKEKLTVSQVVRNYIDAAYPDRYLNPRTGRTLGCEQVNCETLLEHFNGQLWDSLTPRSWDDYAAWRKTTVKKGCTGSRTIDAERVTLSNAFKYSMRRELITANPVEYFPRYQPQSEVKHCREFQPRSADEVHQIAGMLFEKRRSEALGWQMLIEAYSGLRTEEVLLLKVDAKLSGEPGYRDSEGNLHVVRVKHGINPFVHINAGLREVLKAHAVWHAMRYPKNPFMVPGKLEGKPAHKNALQHALRRLRKRIGRKVTSHGMRAFYVLVRRSWGIEDGVIAIELGQGSGSGLISTTYGDIPQNWRNGGGPQLTWLSATPAWADLEKNGWNVEKPCTPTIEHINVE